MSVTEKPTPGTWIRGHLVKGHRVINGNIKFRDVDYQGNPYTMERYRGWFNVPPRARPTADGLTVVHDYKLHSQDDDNHSYVAWSCSWYKDTKTYKHFHEYHVIAGPMSSGDADQLARKLLREAIKLEKAHRTTKTIDEPGTVLRARLGSKKVSAQVGCLVTIDGRDKGVIWQIVAERDTAEPEDFDENGKLSSYAETYRYEFALKAVFCGPRDPSKLRVKKVSVAYKLQPIDLPNLARSVLRLKEVLDENVRLMSGEGANAA